MRPQRKLFQTEACCDFSGTTESSGDTIPNCRVAGKYCHFPAPFELDVRVSPHPARAFTNAPGGARSLLSVFLARGSVDDSWCEQRGRS